MIALRLWQALYPERSPPTAQLPRRIARQAPIEQSQRSPPDEWRVFMRKLLPSKIQGCQAIKLWGQRRIPSR